MKEKEKSKSTCFPRRHMTFEEIGVWVRIREWQSKLGYLWFDGEKVAASVADTGKNTVYRIQKSLLKKGWFIWLQPPSKAYGKYKAGKLRALDHNEWVKTHPNQCPPPENETVPDSGSGGAKSDTNHSRNEERTVPDSCKDRSRFEKSPFPETGRSNGEHKAMDKTKQWNLSNGSLVPENGNGTQTVNKLSGFEETDRSVIGSGLEGKESGVGPNLERTVSEVPVSPEPMQTMDKIEEMASTEISKKESKRALPVLGTIQTGKPIHIGLFNEAFLPMCAHCGQKPVAFGKTTKPDFIIADDFCSEVCEELAQAKVTANAL
jgi:hypothetical protein